MKISKKYPPNYKLIKTVFPHLEAHKPIFAYGDTLFNPFDVVVTPDLEVHEEAHSKRQGNEPEVWWNYYLTDPQFRLNEEIIAYGTQLAYAKNAGVKGKLFDWIKGRLAQSLSGPLYGSLISYGEAESRIRHFAKTIHI